MAGNLLGPRGKYVYEADDGSTYSITTDASLAVAGLGVADAAPVEFDPASPPAGYAGRFPRGAKPRVVHAQDAAGNRKSLVAFDPQADLYQSNLSQNVTIDETVFTTTGRRGETYTF